MPDRDKIEPQADQTGRATDKPADQGQEAGNAAGAELYQLTRKAAAMMGPAERPTERKLKLLR